MLHVSQMVKERHNLRRRQFTGMPPHSGLIPMEFQESPRPLHVRLLRAQAVVLDAQHLPQLIQQFGFGVRDHERSLSRKGFSTHTPIKYNKDGINLNQNPAAATPCYTPFSLPNTC